MKIQRKMNREVASAVTFLFLAQNIFLPFGAQAQSGTQVAGAVLNTVMQFPAMYSQSPTTPNFQGASGSLEKELNSCLIQSTAGISTGSPDAKSFLNTSTEQWKTTLGLNKGTTASTATCDTVCEKPDVSEEPSCSSYGQLRENIPDPNGGTVSKRTPSASQISAHKKAVDSLNKYIGCLDKKKDCADKDQEKLNQQLAAFNCQAQVMQRAVQAASTALQFSIQENQKVFGSMNLHQKEVGEQMMQVDEILGPDPELGKSGASQFQGLLGLQKELNETIPKMVEAETKFKADNEQIKNDTTTNEQNLEATRVNVASQCIKGSRNIGTAGGYSLTCFKPVQTQGKDGQMTPVYDKNGNQRYSKQSCGPYEYIRSKIEQRAFITSRGVIMNQERRDQAAANSAAFDALVDSINRSMGDYDQKASDNSRLDTSIHNWSDVEKKVSGNIDAVSGQSGVDVRGMLRAVAGHCFTEADQWKNQQIRSTSSDYSKKKAEIKTRKTTLTAQMDTGLTSMNKSYGDVMAVLAGKHVTLSRQQCTKDNPDLMYDCFAKSRQNLQNLLEGNGALTTTAKTIKGGTTTPPFVVQCRGINGCVTQFKNVRDMQKQYSRDVQKKKEAYVLQSNQGTQAQLTSMAAQLTQVQNTLLAQYDLMKQTMQKMGVDVAEKPKFMDPEQLQAMEGPPPDKTPGPFQNPKSMASVFSQMMMPGGMINFSDTGLRDAQKQLADKAKEKKQAANETLTTYRGIAKKYANIEAECSVAGLDGASSTTAGSGNVGSYTAGCNECGNLATRCSYAQGVPDQAAITAKQTEVTTQQGVLDKYKTDNKIKDEEACKKKTACKAEMDKLKKYQDELLVLQTPTTSNATFANNISSLNTIAQVCEQLIGGSATKQTYDAGFSSANLQTLMNLDANPNCADIFNKCQVCQTNGKGAFTEDGKMKTTETGVAH